MARPLSEDKRSAILASATELVAMLGTGAPTAKIAAGAGLAEGTLFKYFASKDDLLNQLYLSIKADLARAMLTAYPSKAGVRERALHVWNAIVDWGADDPAKRRAMRQLVVSERITAETKRLGNAAFREVSALLDEALAAGSLRGQPAAFVGAMLEAMADTTLEFVLREPQQREQYKRAGFAAFWSGVAG